MTRAVRHRFLLAVALLSGAAALSRADMILCPQMEFDGPLAEDVGWFASLEPELPTDIEGSDKLAFAAGVSCEPASWLCVEPEFKAVTRGGAAETAELRPLLSLELSRPAGACKVALRNRLEYRMKRGKDEYWRYRTRAKVKGPKVAGARPFAYEEIFYEFGDANERNGNEAGFGATMPVTDHSAIELDLRLCHAKSDGEWEDPDLQVIVSIQRSF